jgi:hypothetical protein
LVSDSPAAYATPGGFVSETAGRPGSDDLLRVIRARRERSAQSALCAGQAARWCCSLQYATEWQREHTDSAAGRLHEPHSAITPASTRRCTRLALRTSPEDLRAPVILQCRLL